MIGAIKHNTILVLYIILFFLLLINGIYVVSFIGDYYPKFEFFYWVVEMVILIHFLYLIKERKFEWKNIIVLSQIEVLFPILFKKGSVKNIAYVVLCFYFVSLPFIPTLALFLAMMDRAFVGVMFFILLVQCILTLLLFVAFQIKLWKMQGEKNETEK